MSKTNNLVVISDLHSGCRVALCPKSVQLDDGGRYTPSKIQSKMLVFWHEFWDEWVPEADLPYLRMGWVKLEEDGEWVSQAKLDREKDIAEKEAGGWKQQPDLVWLSPEEQPKHFDEGLWKCGEEWLTGEAVDEYHAEIPEVVQPRFPITEGMLCFVSI